MRVSPPLLPVTPPYTPSTPATEAMQIDFTSTPEDLIANDAAAAEKAILDSQQVADVTPADGPLFTTQEICAAIDSYTAVPSSSSPLARKRLRGLHLEPPLTPHDRAASTSDDEGSSAKRVKRMHFDSGIAAMIPDLQMEDPDTLPGIAELQDNELQDIILRDAESVQEQLQNEHLIDIDTTLRVRVLHLEPVQAQPPWELHGNHGTDGTTSQTQRTMVRHVSQKFLKDTRKWSGVSKLERTLMWAPFPLNLAKVDLCEQFDDDGSLGILLDDMGLDDGTGDIDVQPMVVRNFQRHESDGDDEEIEPAVFDEDDLDGVIAEEERQSPEHSLTVPLDTEKDRPSPKRQNNLDPFTTCVDQIVPTPSMLPITGTSWTSAATANLMQGDGLAHFMQLRGKAPRISKPVGEELGRSTALVSVLPAPKSNLAPAAVMVPQVYNRQEKKLETATISIPMPEVKKFATHHKIPIIVSSAFMAGNRRLLRLLQTSLPNIDICEREAAFALSHTNSSGDAQTEEADLTISPSSGVILTTLQKLKQKPLPGQQSSPTGSLRARIASTAPRYERLIILVKENSSIPAQPENPTTSAVSSTLTNPLDNLDCTAISEFSAWTVTALTPGPETRILYIPGGDSEAASWLAAAISHNHHPGGLVTDTTAAATDNNTADDAFCLIRDETMWERWLRAAGLNAFAAQVVLRGLRMKDSPPGSGEDFAKPRFGLQAFIAMSSEERIEMFASLLGGERVLKRVSSGLDGGWRGDGSIR